MCVPAEYRYTYKDMDILSVSQKSVCVYACVCVRKRERETDRQQYTKVHTFKSYCDGYNDAYMMPHVKTGDVLTLKIIFALKGSVYISVESGSRHNPSSTDLYAVRPGAKVWHNTNSLGHSIKV